MRMLLNIRFPNEPFNSLVKGGRAGELIKEIIDEIKPESIYFTETNGSRAAEAIVDVKDASQVPSFAEPFFLYFNADCEFHVAMTPKAPPSSPIAPMASQFTWTSRLSKGGISIKQGVSRGRWGLSVGLRQRGEDSRVHVGNRRED